MDKKMTQCFLFFFCLVIRIILHVSLASYVQLQMRTKIEKGQSMLSKSKGFLVMLNTTLPAYSGCCFLVGLVNIQLIPRVA